MNKSLITNLAAIACIVVGCFSPWLSQQIISAGVFALSGAITNWLAVYMLFEKVPLIYGSGVIPLNFENLKQSIRDLVIEQFFQDEIIARFLQKNSSVIISESRMSRFLNLIDYDAVFNTVKSMVLDNGIGGFLKMLGGGSILEGYRDEFREKGKIVLNAQISRPEFQDKFQSLMKDPELIRELSTSLEELIEDRLRELTPELVKELMQKIMRRHLGWLVVWGGVSGGLIGVGISLFRGYLQGIV